MTNKSLEIAKKLKIEASKIIEDFAIFEAISQYGTVQATGSYELDLMAWNDVDIGVQLNEGIESSTAVAGLAYDFIQIPEAVIVKMERGLNKRRPELPKGDYLQLKIDIGNYKLPWKFDIWFLDEENLKNNQKYMQKLKKALTPEKRKLILEMKQAIMLPKGRTPSLSGHHLYQAIIFDNLTDKEVILDYLASKGLNLPQN